VKSWNSLRRSGKSGSRPVPELREKARRGVPFGELGKAEHYLLVDQFDRVRGQYLNRYLIGITRFQLVRWTRDNLAAVYVIPYFVRDVSSLEHLKVTFKQTHGGGHRNARPCQHHGGGDEAHPRRNRTWTFFLFFGHC
jgi:hypothetical protein